MQHATGNAGDLLLKRPSRIFHDATGPMMIYTHGCLYIQDLNPECRMRWRLSRSELLHLGWRMMWIALFRR